MSNLRDVAYLGSAVHESVLSLDDILLYKLHQELINLVVFFLVMGL